jgi:hypothetical protein
LDVDDIQHVIAKIGLVVIRAPIGTIEIGKGRKKELKKIA